MKLWKIPVIAIALSLVFGACSPFPAPTAPTDTPAPTPTLDPCATVQFVSPAGARDIVSAQAYPVDSEIMIQWEPADCVLTVQSYQKRNPVPVTVTKNVESGDKVKIGEPGSGETEIKIWWTRYPHSIFVWIK